ncbi:MAG: DUF4397 domain-containing protein [Anditalea sp.]
MNTKMKNKKFSSLLMKGIGMLSLAFIPFLTSCLNDEDSRLAPTPIAYVSFYHGSPTTSALSIVVDGNLYNTNSFNYSTYFDYGHFFTGDRTFSFKSENAANSLLDTVVTFEADQAYSFFISEEEEGFEPIIVEDELAMLSSGKAMIRMVHLSPDTPAVSLQIDDEESDLIEGQAYREVSDYLEVNEGRIDLNLKTSDGGETLVTAENINIREKRIYTIVVRGYVDPAASAGTANSLNLQLIRNYPNY